MLTIKLPIQNTIDIENEQRIFSSIVRFAYNRFKENVTEKDVRKLIKEKFNMNCKLNSWLIQCAILKGKDIFEKNKDKKVIFGGRKNFQELKEGKISKEQWKKFRLMPLISQGEKLQNGNRMFKLDIIENNQIIIKLNKENHQPIQLPKLRQNIKKQLYKLQELSENKLIPFTIQLTKNYITISFEEFKKEKINYNDKRVIGLDLNPNYIGCAIIEFDNYDNFKILHKQVIDISELNKKSNKSSDNQYSKYLNNKREFELFEIAKYLINLSIHYNCSKFVIEELNIKPSNKKKGRNFNRLVNNVWNRNIFINNLRKRCNINNIEFIQVNPAYSSFIGNINYGNETTPDMVASAIEIARRGYKKYEKNWFYPKVKNINKLFTLWKKNELWNMLTWKEIYSLFKSKSELRYRFLLDKCSSSLSLFKYKSKIYIYLYSFK